MFVFKLSIVSLGISMYESAFSILEFGQNSIVVATVDNGIKFLFLYPSHFEDKVQLVASKFDTQLKF